MLQQATSPQTERGCADGEQNKNGIFRQMWSLRESTPYMRYRNEAKNRASGNEIRLHSFCISAQRQVLPLRSRNAIAPLLNVKSALSRSLLLANLGLEEI